MWWCNSRHRNLRTALGEYVNWSKLVRGSTSAIVFATLLGGCASQSTDDYNLCALGMGAAGLGVGLASGGTGSVVLATGAGAGIGYLVCGEELPAPAAEPAVDNAVPAMVETDGDGDGVPDHRDDCPNTEPGVAVDDRGCALPIILDSAMLNFAFDSAVLPSNAADSLQAFVNYIKRYPDATFEVAGHADSTGPESYNQGLSERRAAAVAGYLESQGVPPGRLRVVGYGELEPIASNETESGRARNRRVEVRVIDDAVAENPQLVEEPSVYELLPFGDQAGQRFDQVAAKATGMNIALGRFDATDLEAGRGLIAGKGHRPGTEIAIRSRIKEQDFHPVVPVV